MMQDKKLAKKIEEFEALCQSIALRTAVGGLQETDQQRNKRIRGYLNQSWAGFNSFAKYYFPHLIDSDFGWFHRKSFKNYVADKNYKGAWEWPRGHAKSIFLLMLCLYDKAYNTVEQHYFTGLIVASVTDDKATDLLASIQAELMSNQLYINDYGKQYSHGDWSKGNFSTTDGCGFWSFGLGQNPAGSRKGGLRPNRIYVDDADDKRRANNPLTVYKDMDWLNGELAGCFDIKRGGKFVYVNNRVHRAGLTAHFVGDVEPGDPKDESVDHIKVFLTEDPKTHERLDIDSGGMPAWRERIGIAEAKELIRKAGSRNAERQYYHHHVEEGHVFLDDWIIWDKIIPLTSFEAIVTYCDPSWKDSKSNDFKAIACLGLYKGKYYLIDIFCRQCSLAVMASAHLDMQQDLLAAGVRGARHFFEGNFTQDSHKDVYDEVASQRGIDNLIRPDYDSKDNKVSRIAAMDVLFEYGNVIFNQKIKNKKDTKQFLTQLLEFPYHAFDDGPDAFEGATSKLRTKRRAANRSTRARQGQFKRNPKR